jgi:hypothetical protein
MTEADLKQAIEYIRKQLNDPLVQRKPTKVMYRPADLKALGLTHDDVIKLIKEQA